MDTSQIQQDVIPVIKSCFTDKFVDFQSRSGQNEFAIFMVFALLALAVFYAIASGLGSLAGLIFLIPSLALTVRRLNDIGMQAIFAILFFVPLVNIAFLIYIGIQPSKA